MIYIIADGIAFNPDDCTLVNLHDDDFVKLSIPACRLLENLLNSRGELVSREFLLTEVWDKYGLRGSNSNLNQYLSILRRTLANYGCDNLIVTVPKMGFCLNTEVPLRRQDSPAVESARTDTAADDGNAIEPPIPEADAGIAVPAASADSAGHRRQLKKRWFLGLLLVASVALLAGLLVRLNDVYSQRAIEPVDDMLGKDCQVTYLKPVVKADRAAINKQINEILNENKLHCDSNRRIIFDNSTSYTSQHYGRTMLSFCQLGFKRSMISCDNFYYYDWRPR